MTKEQTSWFCCIKVGDTRSPWRLRLTGGKVKCYLNANHELLSPNIRNPFITEFVIHVTSREKGRVDGNALLVLNIRKLRPGSYEKNSIPLKKSFPEKEKKHEILLRGEMGRGGSSSRPLTSKLQKIFYENSNLWNITIFVVLKYGWLSFWLRECQTFAPLYHNFAQEGKREGNFLIGFQLLKFEL